MSDGSQRNIGILEAPSDGTKKWCVPMEEWNEKKMQLDANVMFPCPN